MMVTPYFAQARGPSPTCRAQLDVDAGGGLVEEQDRRLVAQRLGDHHPALHAAGQRHDLLVLLVPEAEVLQHLLQVRGFGGLPNRPRLNFTVSQTVSKASVEISCGTRPILARAARKSFWMSWPSAVTVRTSS
jgi:hypothetical protein